MLVEHIGCIASSWGLRAKWAQFPSWEMLYAFFFPLVVRDGKLPLGSMHLALFFLPPLLSLVIKAERKTKHAIF